MKTILTTRNLLAAIPAAVALIVNREALAAWLRSISTPIIYFIVLILIILSAVAASALLVAFLGYVGALLKAVAVRLTRRFYERHFGWISVALQEHDGRIRNLERWQRQNSVCEDNGILYLPDFLSLEQIRRAVNAYGDQRGLEHLGETLIRALVTAGRPEGHNYRVFNYKNGRSLGVTWLSTRDEAESCMTKEPHSRARVLVHVWPALLSDG